MHRRGSPLIGEARKSHYLLDVTRRAGVTARSGWRGVIWPLRRAHAHRPIPSPGRRRTTTNHTAIASAIGLLNSQRSSAHSNLRSDKLICVSSARVGHRLMITGDRIDVIKYALPADRTHSSTLSAFYSLRYDHINCNRITTGINDPLMYQY